MNWMILPCRRYAEFTGRSRRMEFWMFTLFTMLVGLAIAALFGTNEMSRMQYGFMLGTNLTGIGGMISGLFNLVSLIPSIAVSVRRLHDIDRSGWWLLLIFLPILGWFVLLVFYCLNGTPGPNRFGDDPKQPGVGPGIFS